MAGPCGRSSVGRASASQAEGRGFDPRRPLGLVAVHRLNPCNAAVRGSPGSNVGCVIQASSARFSRPVVTSRSHRTPPRARAVDRCRSTLGRGRVAALPQSPAKPEEGAVVRISVDVSSSTLMVGVIPRRCWTWSVPYRRTRRRARCCGAWIWSRWAARMVCGGLGRPCGG